MKITGIIVTASNVEALKAKRKRQTRRLLNTDKIELNCE